MGGRAVEKAGGSVTIGAAVEEGRNGGLTP
jgi:hypothetical protein